MSALATTLELAVALLRKQQSGVWVFTDAEDMCRRVAAILISRGM